jgi:hypothetical protein
LERREIRSRWSKWIDGVSMPYVIDIRGARANGDCA